MKMEDLQDLFVDQLKDLYSAENQLIKALPKMAKKATNEELRAAFETHLEETRGHAERLTQVFEKLGASPRGKKCKAMEGLIEEGKEIMQEDAEPEAENSTGFHAPQESARILQSILDEEGKTDKLLTQLAESSINLEAAGA